MKIHDLEVCNLRGIKGTLKITPNEKNLVIFGNNGTGKSGIVDALDFLFSGDISRLKGAGTSGITLSKFGPHIDVEKKAVKVKAKVGLDDGNSVILERLLSKPKELIIYKDGKIIDRSSFLELDLDSISQLFLTRADILKYVAVESGKRAEEVQAVLGLDKIESIRTILGKIKTSSAREYETAKSNLTRTESQISAVSGLESFSESSLLDKINGLRNILDAEPIANLNSGNLKQDVFHTLLQDSSELDPSIIKSTLIRIKEFIFKNHLLLSDKIVSLKSDILVIQKDTDLLRNVDLSKLVSLGIKLLDGSGLCPLCRKEWDKKELESYLLERKIKAEEGRKLSEKIDQNSSDINELISVLIGFIEKLTSQITKLNLRNIELDLMNWKDGLEEWLSNFLYAIENHSLEFSDIGADYFLARQDFKDHYIELLGSIRHLKKSTPMQDAWDKLTSIAVHLETYYSQKVERNQKSYYANKTKSLFELYTNTKDNILADLYKSVCGKFVDYYKILHADEESFSATLKPEGASLEFLVDFYERGENPPRSLHSEGHQDSMGLCLFLALCNYFADSNPSFLVLDDVVMSIDDGHRRAVCKLLTQEFQDWQLIITTHNRNWARQLRSTGIVDKNSLLEFRSWTVDDGPFYQFKEDIWEEIIKNTDQNDITLAAQQLREYLEFFYEDVCSELRAKVIYKSDGRNEFGEYFDGALDAYKRYLRKAKDASSSWNDKEKLELYEIIESSFSKILEVIKQDQWEINENVHYSRWKDFGRDDFKPLVMAFKELEKFYRCDSCHHIVAVTMSRSTVSSVKCPCAKVNWNLAKKI